MEWWEWVLIAFLVLLAIGVGGYVRKLSKELKEASYAMADLLDAFDTAIQDDTITKEEWLNIMGHGKIMMSEAKDVGIVVAEIISMVIKKKLAK